jgi:hypothetical protein
MVVWTVPEHDGGLDSPRAQGWSGQSPSTRVVGTIPNHKKCGKKPFATCTIMPLLLLFFVFAYVFALTSPVKKVDGYSTSFAFLSCQANSCMAPVSRCVSVGPPTLATKRRIYWHRSRGCENNHLRCVRTSPKNSRQTKRHNSWVKYGI